jgi:hypothetical protein
MIVRSRLLQAMYADAVFDGAGRVVCAYTDRPGTPVSLRIEREEEPGAWALRTDPIGFPAGLVQQRLAVSPLDVVAVVGHFAGRAVVWISGVGVIGDAGACIARPIIRWKDSAFDLAIPTTGSTHTRWRLAETGETRTLDVNIPNAQSSSGFTNFGADDRPVIFPERGVVINNRWVGFPCTAGDVTVGQGMAGLLLSTGGILQTLDPTENPMEPHVDGTSARCVVIARLQQAFGATRILVCGPPYEPDPPIVVVDEPLEPPALAPIGTRLTCCYPGNYGIQVEAPGNCLMVGTAADLDAVLFAGNHRLILACGAAAIDIVAPSWYRVYGVLVDGERDVNGEQRGTVRENVEANAAAAKARMAALGLAPRPILAYQQNLVERIPGVDLPLLCSYWDYEPSPEAYASWLRGAALTLAPFIVLAQAHDRRVTHGPSPLWTEAALCRLQARHNEALRHPDCSGVLWFAYLREGGLVFDPAVNEAGPTCHPVELRWIEAICGACDAPQIAPDPDPPEPPEPPTPPVVVPPVVVPPAPVPQPAPKKGWVEKYFGWE